MLFYYFTEKFTLLGETKVEQAIFVRLQIRELFWKILNLHFCEQWYKPPSIVYVVTSQLKGIGELHRSS